MRVQRGGIPSVSLDCGSRGGHIFLMTLRIGILALQGAVQPHFAHIAALGAEPREVRTAAELAQVDGLVLPGGESSAMLKIIDYYDLKQPLVEFFKTKPAWGICAGAILLAEKVKNPDQFSFGALPMTVARNAYGSQLDSFHAEVNGYPIAFIRAPVIEYVAPDMKILAERGGHPIWVEHGHTMATTFHAELNPAAPSPMHQRFAQIIKAAKQPR